MMMKLALVTFFLALAAASPVIKDMDPQLAEARMQFMQPRFSPSLAATAISAIPAIGVGIGAAASGFSPSYPSYGYGGYGYGGLGYGYPGFGGYGYGYPYYG